MEQCKGCYRDAPGGCEVFKEKDRPKNCWAKQTDIWEYIYEQEKLLRYNKDLNNVKGIAVCRKSLKRVKGANR
jgi:hypothetical protein